MRHWLLRRLDSTSTVYVACAFALALGLVFVFVWAPHPWGWQGIDQYHELARALVRGESFGTTDVPWGYAYYVAAMYALFGEQTWVPVTGQAIINAALPWLVYVLVRGLTTMRIAVLSSLLTGLFSFNTVYASTQSTDSICTVLFVGALIACANALRSERWTWFAVAGALLGAVPQFRPNLILFPVVAAMLYVAWPPRSLRKVGNSGIMLAMVLVALTPWIARNYRLTGLFLPTSTHGGVQLWYGTLQVGPYLESRAANPRAAFGPASFPYTSIVEQPLVVRAFAAHCGSWETASVNLVTWTNRDPTRRRFAPHHRTGMVFVFEVPPQPSPTVFYYYVEARWPDESITYTTPPAGKDEPLVHFVSSDHLTDLDTHDDLLDVFDITRMIRAVAWQEPLHELRADFDTNGRIERGDLAHAISVLLAASGHVSASEFELRTDASAATLRLADGSSLEVPRAWQGKLTDLVVVGDTAQALLHTRRTWSRAVKTPLQARDTETCRRFEDVAVNDVFYRAEVDAMRRYTALALDNIYRDPFAFLAASGYRMVRLFVVRGSDDPDAAQQFELSGILYTIATAATAVYLMLFGIGIVVARRTNRQLLVLLVPILYVPLTICFVLTNMRYTITMQPLVFTFIATALVRLLAHNDRAATTVEP
jgi:hypothetical protein